jgi:hypothetical protein
MIHGTIASVTAAVGTTFCEQPIIVHELPMHPMEETLDQSRQQPCAEAEKTARARQVCYGSILTIGVSIAALFASNFSNILWSDGALLTIAIGQAVIYIASLITFHHSSRHMPRIGMLVVLHVLVGVYLIFMFLLIIMFWHFSLG